MYRRLAALVEPDDVEAFAAELIDRFGPLPDETEQLLQLVRIKQLCRRAGVAKVEAGPKGVLLAFHDNRFARPERLVGFIAEHAKTMRVRSDHRLVISGETKTPAQRLKRVQSVDRGARPPRRVTCLAAPHDTARCARLEGRVWRRCSNARGALRCRICWRGAERQAALLRGGQIERSTPPI